MKIKSDFVTNSSSTSYVGWGIDIEKHQLTNFPKFSDMDGDIDYYSITDGFKTISCKFDYNSDRIYIVGHPTNMRLEETLLDFKNRIASELTELTGEEFKESDLEFVEEVSYN